MTCHSIHLLDSPSPSASSVGQLLANLFDGQLARPGRCSLFYDRSRSIPIQAEAPVDFCIEIGPLGPTPPFDGRPPVGLLEHLVG
jgi:hypothetical protein